MIKVLFVRNVSPKNFGGIKKHCEDLSVLFKSDKDISILPIADIPTRFIPVIKKTIFKTGALYKYVKESYCDIVHIHGFASLDVIQSFLVAKILGKKIVYSPHYHPFKFLSHPLLGKFFFYGCLRFLLQFASTIVTITQNDTNFFKRNHRVVYKIPHFFEPLKTRTYIASKKSNMILFVGRNDENKGIPLLYKLNAKYEVHLVTRGTVERSDFILHNHISNEELSSLYEQASLVVIPSRYEAFSYVALEAFAHSTPVVMSDTVMIADYLKGYDGYMTFRYGDVNGFLQAVEETIGRSVDTDKILAIFEKKKIREQYKDMYTKVINK